MVASSSYKREIITKNGIFCVFMFLGPFLVGFLKKYGLRKGVIQKWRQAYFVFFNPLHHPAYLLWSQNIWSRESVMSFIGDFNRNNNMVIVLTVIFDLVRNLWFTYTVRLFEIDNVLLTLLLDWSNIKIIYVKKQV